ncbi:MAG: helix-turn-helix transcriptional regulator [Planctomycetota bacterium]|nr:helix-turn-helix transcriptional regulator [Planctomycetota bacterium]
MAKANPPAPSVEPVVPTRDLKFGRKGHRSWITGRVEGFPEFTHIGHDTFTKVSGLGKHEHPGMFEYCLIIRGHVTWWAQERIYQLRGGDVYFTWPDEPHGGMNELMTPCTIYWTILDIPRPGDKRAQSFLSLPPSEARDLCERIYAVKDRHLKGAERLEPYYKEIFRGLEMQSRLGVIHARAALQGMFATLVELPVAAEPEGFIPPGVARARAFLDDCPRPWPTVEELAKLAGMSSSHFHATFRRTVGMAPMEYAHHRRLDHASRLLAAKEASVTAIAARLGYCSSQHLATCYKRYLGTTPTAVKSKT